MLETGVTDLKKAWPGSINYETADNQLIKIGLFGSFEERKGQDIAAHAFSLLPKDLRDRAELHFFGRTLDRHFESEVKQLWAHDPHIIFNGEAHHPEYFDRLMDMDIVVIPSRDDPLPLVALDALALGKTIVCSSTTGTASHLEHGVSGYIIGSNNAQEWSAIFAQLVADKIAREKVRAGARRVFEAKFTVEAFRRRLFDGIQLTSTKR